MIMTVSKRTAVANFKRDLIDAVTTSVKTLLDSEIDIIFNALALEANLETLEITVSMNTEFDFHRKRRYYERNSEETVSIVDLRYSIRDWNYQAIAVIQPMPDNLYEAYYAKKPESYLELLTNTLLEFEESECFITIPKDSTFLTLAMGTEETIDASFMRYAALKTKREARLNI